jgi:hypothetical protein
MKKRNLKNVLRFQKTTIVNLREDKIILGGKPPNTNNSCPEFCQTIPGLDCSYGGNGTTF